MQSVLKLGILICLLRVPNFMLPALLQVRATNLHILHVSVIWNIQLVLHRQMPVPDSSDLHKHITLLQLLELADPPLKLEDWWLHMPIVWPVWKQ